MLVSHINKFIFLKTIKTGGTSVEIFFEEFSVFEPKTYSVGEESTKSVETSAGIVGARGPSIHSQSKITYFNHIPAKSLKSKIGDDIWNAYFKFSIVRNPYDELVSRFWFYMGPKRRLLLANSEASTIHSHFREWVMTQKNLNSPIYLIRDQLAVDYLIRYESLREGVEKVCSILGLTKSISELGSFKGNFRPKDKKIGGFRDYFDLNSINHVKANFAWEIETFGYDLNDCE